MKGEGSGAGSVIEELAKTDCEQEITENGMVQAGQEQRAGGLIGEREEKPANQAQAHGQPVPENDVNKPKRQRAGEQHAPTAAEQRLVAMKEKCPVEKFLRIDRKKRVEKKNERPEQGRAPDKRKEELRRHEVDGNSETQHARGIPDQECEKERPDVTPRTELRTAERRVTPDEKKGQERNEEEIRYRQVGNAAVIDEKRNNYINGGELDDEKK
jgi:hypothetical protein